MLSAPDTDPIVRPTPIVSASGWWATVVALAVLVVELLEGVLVLQLLRRLFVRRAGKAEPAHHAPQRCIRVCGGRAAAAEASSRRVAAVSYRGQGRSGVTRCMGSLCRPAGEWPGWDGRPGRRSVLHSTGFAGGWAQGAHGSDGRA